MIEGEYHCYDLNASFPRYSVVSGDTVDLTIRLASAGANAIRGVLVEVYADTSNRDSNFVDGQIVRLPEGVVKAGERVISEELRSQDYRDIRFEVLLPNGTKRVWFVVDGVNRYFECIELDNLLRFDLE